MMSSSCPNMVVDLVGLLNGKNEEGVGPLNPQRLPKPKKGDKTTVDGIKAAPTAPGSACEQTNVNVSTNDTLPKTKTNGLSKEWKKLFTVKKTAPNSPKKSMSPVLLRKNGASSPKRTFLGSPRRRNSPSPKRLNFISRSVGQQPLKRSLNHSLGMCSTDSQSTAKRSSRISFDTTPYTGLFHVQQKDLDDPFWHLSPSTVVPCREIQKPDLKIPNGSIPMSLVKTAGGGNTSAIPNVHFELCSECEREAALTRLCQNHPHTDVRGLYSHYHSLTTDTSSQQLKCSIRVKRNQKGHVEVDPSFYPCAHPPLILGEHMYNEVWSDVYRPRKTDDVIGNRLACSQLRNWLRVWKDKCVSCTSTPSSSQSSTSKPMSKPLQSKLNASSTARLVEKDDDFVSLEHIRIKRGVKRVLSKVTSDSEEEDSDDNGDVCSAALVCGPHGCGKTAGIYAIAEELGFKVYEVNSSSVRSKVQLSSLREATLSHQVTVGEKTSQPLNRVTSGGGGGGLMSFFRKLPKESKSVALESTTVILLDEVDVLFESDRGFWTGVHELLSATKRPFVMTCSAVDFDLDCDHVKVVFDLPPIADVSLHIQVLSLVHGLSISAQSANTLAKNLKCDLRKILNYLHIHLPGIGSIPPPISGPSLSFKPHPSTLTSHTKMEESDNSQSSLAQLRMAFDEADALASIDLLTSSSESMTHHHHHTLWWRNTPMDSLMDEQSDNRVISSLSDISIYLGQDQSHSELSLEEYHRTKQLHTSQMKCTALFSHPLWALSHVSFITEGLPFVSMVCDAESVRQLSNTSRRFRHYFKPFPIDLCDLQNFNDISKYLY